MMTQTMPREIRDSAYCLHPWSRPERLPTGFHLGHETKAAPTAYTTVNGNSLNPWHRPETLPIGSTQGPRQRLYTPLATRTADSFDRAGDKVI